MSSTCSFVKRITWSIIYIILFNSISLFGQNTIEGDVFDNKTKDKLIGATIFLANTTKACLSDNGGHFVLKNIPKGNFQLIVSYVGYGRLSILVNAEAKKTYKFLLDEDSSLMNEVTVKAKKRHSTDWEKNLNFFIANFIGESENAATCKITNPNVLVFNTDTAKFNVKTNDALLVENRGLGYMLKFQIEHYTYFLKEGRINYTGYVNYDTLVPKNNREKQEWIANRRKAYLGSPLHFMRSLYAGNLRQEGFYLRKIMMKYNKKGEEKQVALVPDTSLLVRNPFSQKLMNISTVSYYRILDSLKLIDKKVVLNFKNRLEVTFINEEEPYRYIKTKDPLKIGISHVPQSTIIDLLEPEITVQEDGQYFPLGSIHSKGYWSWELIAEELPIDYYPDH